MRNVRVAPVLAVLVTAAPALAGPPPPLASPSVAVLDAATGDALYAWHADEPRPIASMTKIFVAMAVRRRHLDLERWTEIDFDDARASAGGAHTRLLEGEAFRNRDLLYAMLLSSDNRVPSALARSVGLSNPELVAELGHLAGDLGLSHTRFDDATGLRGNRSTAHEMALALRETLRDGLLARIMTTRHARVVSRSAAITASYTSTVQPLWDHHYKILGGKTGHTDAAGYCLLIAAEVAGRRVIVALLGARTPQARFDDFARLIAWLA
ncbi:MAG TPA: serine hydrolase, partial [Kofleriaceae bacterium]|nr:serine hydrolase [Kofleriaceae bacterium]